MDLFHTINYRQSKAALILRSSALLLMFIHLDFFHIRRLLYAVGIYSDCANSILRRSALSSSRNWIYLSFSIASFQFK